MAIAILSQGVFDFEPAAPTYTQSFAVPAGTDMLLVLPTMRQISGATGAPTITLLSYNGVAMTAGFNNYAAGGTGDINSLIGYLRNPSIGTFDVVMNSSNTAGGAVWMLALSGVKATGTPVGITAAQKISASGATSVGLGLTPSFAGSLLLTALGSGANTGTVTGFTGTGFTETITGRYGNNGDMPYTARYRLNVPATATTVSASFSLASPNCGGLLAEILAEASATTDVAGTADATVAVVGSISSGLAQAEILDAGFRQLSAWTEILSLQADVAGVDRRIISAGVLGTPTLTLDLLAANKNCSWGYRLSDGNVRIDSGTNTQSLSPQHLALIHNGAAGQAILLNGVVTGGIVEGAGLSGSLVLPTGGERIGSHGSISPAPYTGLIGRYLLYGQAMSVEQVRLLALSETDPDALWGVGSEDDAQVSNQSLVACPLHSELDGQATVEIIPVILDPSGGALTVTAVTQPANGTLAISGLRLIYNPTRGWQGTDSATYTASDGIKSSTGKLTFRQTRPALKCTNDDTNVAPLGSVIFDPRTNDVGAGPLTIVANSTPSRGAVTVEADGRLKYTNQTGGTSDSFSYTVQDAYSSQSATVSVMITAGSFLAAGDVSQSTTQDKFIDIDVVAAANASDDLKPIVVESGSITTPTMGGTAALQADGKIRYTPETGESGYTDQFDFVLKPSAAATPTDTGTVSVQVQAASGLPRRQPAVAVNKWHCVGFTQAGSKRDDYGSGRAGFAAAVASSTLVAGDVIVLADDTYSGTKITVTKNGTASTDGSSHIMVRARTHGRAIINLQLDVNGEYWWFTGLKLPWDGGFSGGSHNDPNHSILCRKRGLWVTNCSCTSAAFMQLIYSAALGNLRFCYNNLFCVCPADAFDMGVFALSDWDSGSATLPTDTDIAWNRITYGPASTTNSDGACRRTVLLIQHGKVTVQTGRDFRFHHNHCAVNSQDMIYCKRNFVMAYNYLEWKTARGTDDMTFRHGLIPTNPAYDTGGMFIGNRLRDPNNVTINLNGSGIVVNGNIVEGGGVGLIMLSAGIINTPLHDAAEHAQLIENHNFTYVEVGQHGTGDTIGNETSDPTTGRNGWPKNIRIYKGDSGWNPLVQAAPGGPTGMWTVMAANYGTGNAAKVTPITVAELASAGCETMP